MSHTQVPKAPAGYSYYERLAWEAGYAMAKDEINKQRAWIKELEEFIAARGWEPGR